MTNAIGKPRAGALLLPLWIALSLAGGGCGRDKPAKHLAKGMQLQQEQRFEEAQLEGLWVLLREPENEAALQLVATSLLEQNRDGEAEAYFRTLAELDPGRTYQAGELYAAKAKADYQAGEKSRARRRWTTALAFNGTLDLGPYSFFMAENEYEAGNYPLAARLYARALESYPDSSAVRGALYPYALSLQRSERWGEAMGVLDRYLRSYPRHADRHEAIWLYQEILIHEAKAARANLDYDGCIELLRRALRFDENPTQSGAALLELGNCYEDMRDYPAAARAYRRIVDLNPAGSGRIYDSAMQRLETLEKARLK